MKWLKYITLIILLIIGSTTINSQEYCSDYLYEPFSNTLPSDKPLNLRSRRDIKNTKTGKVNHGRYDNTTDSRPSVGIHTKDVSTSNPYGSGFFGGLLWGITEATGGGGTVTIIVDGKKQTIYIYNNGSNDDWDKYNEDDGYKDWINGGNIGTYSDYSVATPLCGELSLLVGCVIFMIIKFFKNKKK